MSLHEFHLLDKQVEGLPPGDTGALAVLLAKVETVIRGLEMDYKREEIIAQMPGIRAIAATSPFVKRAQVWPKGYQGDYETIGHIIAQQNKAEPGSFGYAIEDFFLRSAICAQHNNKISAQAALIAQVVAKKEHARLLSVGCGTSEDMRLNIEALKQTNAAITLIDIDSDAIAHSLSVLDEIKDSITIMRGNVYKLVRRLAKQYDLVIIGGVFDYLSDKAIISILSTLKEHINKGGTIFFTNIGNDNPFRIYMEYIADWVLIERSKEDITRLLHDSHCDEMTTNIWLDDTGLTYMVTLSHHN